MTTDLFLQLGSDTYVKMKLFLKKLKNIFLEWQKYNLFPNKYYKTLDKHETPPIEPLSVYRRFDNFPNRICFKSVETTNVWFSLADRIALSTLNNSGM